ncbi:FkbM family methyltransferase [Nitrosopumilus sp.]|uniref:FkbM family methyltransferase n=1 Tax=Nitrosopumilus sp. TaxID=2024843 RepID=UPI003D0A1995
MNKIKFLIQTIQKIKNWHIIPLVYFGLYNKKYFILEFKNGLKCKLRTKETDIHAFANVWLVQEYKSIGFKIDENIPIIDVGAHVGLFALYASQFCKKGKILCFEPVKENFQLLQENIKMNKLTNILLYNKAVSAKDEKIKIFLDENDSAAHNIFEKKDRFEEIESVSIQTIIEDNNLEECNIKLDCEGAEFEILKNLSKNHIKIIKKICLEYHIINENFDDLSNLKKSLKEHFRLIEIKTSKNLGILYAEK